MGRTRLHANACSWRALTIKINPGSRETTGVDFFQHELTLIYFSACLLAARRFSIVLRRILRLTGLLKYSVAPARRQRSRSPGIARAVRAMIGMEATRGFARK